MRYTSRQCQRFTSLVLVGCFALGCSSPGCDEPPPTGPSCAAGYFYYADQLCGLAPPDSGPTECSEEGDGRCYQECIEDADCMDPCRPYCRRLGLYNGGDFNCNRVVRICRAEDRDDCAR